MSVSFPDDIPDDVKAALDDALHAVFDRTVPNPHERGELRVAESATVEPASDDGWLIAVHWPHSLEAYVDATDAGENYENTDGHAENPGMVVYHTLRGHGIPVPEDSPATGVMFDRQSGTVEIRARVNADDFGGDI